MHTEDCSFKVGSETLVATKVFADSGRAPTGISFHGTGSASDRKRVRYMLDYLAEHGISSVCFDFSGHGESTGNMDQATVNIRLREARAAAEFLDPAGPRVIIGSSMGGFLAAMLAREIGAQTLILISPSAYPAAAFDCKLGEDFVAVTRRPGAYIGSPAFAALADFRGNLLIVGGRHDAIIPNEVLELYRESAPLAMFKELIWLEQADHKVHVWLEQHDDDRSRVLPIILQLSRG